MALWVVTVGFGLLFLFELARASSSQFFGIFRGRGHARELQSVVQKLHELQETIEAGLVPDPIQWKGLEALPSPWGELSFKSLKELRESGGAVLPTLKRIRGLAEEHRASLDEARARSSQALAQALVCAALVPIFGLTLYSLLPGVGSHGIIWSAVCGAAMISGAFGALWLLKMADSARWAGLPKSERPWILGAYCVGERLLALLRAGTPGDIAWARASGFLSGELSSLGRAWGGQVWSKAPDAEKLRSPAADAIVEAGSALKKSIQLSVMEGRSCVERVEAALAALRADLKSHSEKELGLLATRALKPLFICVAPALLGLLAVGMYLAWMSAWAS